jgi:hypothetical protein
VQKVPRERIEALRERELERFAELRPRGMRTVQEARAVMPNGVPMTWMVSIYEHPPAVVDRGARARGPAFPAEGRTERARSCRPSMPWLGLRDGFRLPRTRPRRPSRRRTPPSPAAQPSVASIRMLPACQASR